jgi:hypothetical protein
MKPKGDIKELRWIRIFSPSHIPKYLVEQIAKRDYSVDDLYTYLEGSLLKQGPQGPTLNPTFHVWALVDPQNLVKGFLWFTVDPLSKDMAIQAYSVDREYWGSKQAVEKLAKHMKEIRKNAKLKKIYWITAFPKHASKHGFVKSKNVLFEYTEDQEVKNDDSVHSVSGEKRKDRIYKEGKSS